MITIAVNPKTPYRGSFNTNPNSLFLASVLGRTPEVEAQSRTGITTPKAKIGSAPTSLLAQTIHECFAQHIPLCLRPEVIWYAVFSQFATDVVKNPAAYRDIFTTSSEQETIVVINDNLRLGHPDGWDITIPQFEGKLKEKVPSDIVGVALPSLTTMDDEARVATLVSLMDAASPFYKFEVWTRCGIPSVRLEGTTADWNRIVAGARQLEAMSRTPLMKLYFENLIPVLEEIAATAGGKQNAQFWQNIYKANEVSGGVAISGWITAFFAYMNDKKGGVKPKEDRWFDWQALADHWGAAFGPDSFTSHVSAVDFLWRYLGTPINMQFIGGVLGVDNQDGYLTPRLGWAVIHK